MGKFKLVSLVIVLCLIPVLARSQGQLTACKSNLKNIATALEMYSTDFSGHYPPRLGHLVPNYLKTIPSCPNAGSDTYSTSYYQETRPDIYSLYCDGHNHHAIDRPPNWPAYDIRVGLRDSYPVSVTIDDCEKDLMRTVELLETYRKKQGKYPEELSEIKSAWAHSEKLIYFVFENRFELRCPGALHVSQGGQAFYPRYTSEGGLQNEQVQLVADKRGQKKWNFGVGGLSIGLLLLGGLLAVGLGHRGAREEPTA